MSLDHPSRDAQSVLNLLTAPMDRKPRDVVLRRHAAMIRELAFLIQSDDRRVSYLRQKGWSDERFYVLFALNCVYQEVLGPLHASSEVGAAGLGTEHPIHYGSEVFDQDRAKRVRFAVQDFFNLVTALHFSREWMSKNTCGDLVYFIERKEREEEQR
jgi:hypothetical protein